MIRTVVCEKEGCTGNSFFIRSNDNNTLTITCNKCESTYTYEDYHNSANKIYSKCVKCGNPP